LSTPQHHAFVTFLNSRQNTAAGRAVPGFAPYRKKKRITPYYAVITITI